MRPYQAFIRRNDPAESSSLSQKTIQRSAAMSKSYWKRIKHLRSIADENGELVRLKRSTSHHACNL